MGIIQMSIDQFEFPLRRSPLHGRSKTLACGPWCIGSGVRLRCVLRHNLLAKTSSGLLCENEESEVGMTVF